MRHVGYRHTESVNIQDLIGGGNSQSENTWRCRADSGVPGSAVLYFRLDYCDEAVRDSSQTVPVDIHQPPAFLHKILQLTSVQLLYESTGSPQVTSLHVDTGAVPMPPPSAHTETSHSPLP